MPVSSQEPEQPIDQQAALACWYLSGPTASGKTSIGLALAERLGAEVISLDSMAIYREMDVGTAKPTHQQRIQRQHHLIDILDPTGEFSVSQYVEAAHEKIREIKSRGREALFVGGTPLYLKAMLRGLDQGPAADWDFRQQVEAEVQQVGLEALHQRLQQVDPLTAAKLHPHDKRRIIRALEVYKLTGEPISHRQLQFEEERSAEECKVFVLAWPRPALHARIDARVDAMFAAGLVDEVRGLLDRYGRLSRTASQAVGYREVIAHLAGECDLAQTIEQVKARTRQFARRQETWFRSLSECRRVELADHPAPGAVAGAILKMAENSPN